MHTLIPKLRPTLDFFPSPNPEQPGLVIRDPYQFADSLVVLPPALVSGLRFFDGESTELDLRTHFTRVTGELVTGPLVRQLVDTLRAQGFLLTEEFERMREAKHMAFAASPVRKPSMAGSGYPDSPEQLRRQLDGYLAGAAASLAASAGSSGPHGSADTLDSRLIGIAAPHVSLDGGAASYGSAYTRMADALSRQDPRTLVILGTSHYGEPGKFGVTRKSFETPLGALPVEVSLVDEIVEAGGDAVVVEDYCHAIEHSIELQCLFIRQIVGLEIPIVPILCGPLTPEMMRDHGTDDGAAAFGAVERFVGALGGIAGRHGSRLFWILGVDLAHIGRRYGDDFDAQAEAGQMLQVRGQDQARLERICAGDLDGFVDLVTADGDTDPLRWCGLSPLYLFLRTLPGVRADLWNYEQWNIDPQSVVTFAAMGFRSAD